MEKQAKPHLTIIAESPPERCEICHQSDLFDASKNYCARCSGITPTPATISVRSVRSVRTQREPSSNIVTYLLGFFIGACIFLPIKLMQLAMLAGQPAAFRQELRILLRRLNRIFYLMRITNIMIGGFLGALMMFLLSIPFYYTPIGGYHPDIINPIIIGFLFGALLGVNVGTSS